MATFVGIRALNRSSRVRVSAVDSTGASLGQQAVLPTVTTIVDLDDTRTRRDLAHHSSTGQYIVVAANAFVGTTALPANHA